MEISKEEIKEKLGIDEKREDYIGLDMGSCREHDQEEAKRINHNILTSCFYQSFKDISIEDLNLWCWKGSIWVGSKSMDEVIKDFTGLGSEDIIYWLIKNVDIFKKNRMERFLREQKIKGEERYIPLPKIKEESISRVITRSKRYEVLRRQKWRCNQCDVKLKYSKDSDWDGEVAHIDHIHPFSKRKSYPNGEKNINEIENLQALCPKCNLKKGRKEIH